MPPLPYTAFVNAGFRSRGLARPAPSGGSPPLADEHVGSVGGGEEGLAGLDGRARAGESSKAGAFCFALRGGAAGGGRDIFEERLGRRTSASDDRSRPGVRLAMVTVFVNRPEDGGGITAGWCSAAGDATRAIFIRKRADRRRASGSARKVRRSSGVVVVPAKSSRPYSARAHRQRRPNRRSPQPQRPQDRLRQPLDPRARHVPALASPHPGVQASRGRGRTMARSLRRRKAPEGRAEGSAAGSRSWRD